MSSSTNSREEWLPSISKRSQKRNGCPIQAQSPNPGAGSPADVVGRSHQALKEYQAGILAEYVPYTPLTEQNLKKLADLKPKTLAIMHGSSFTGDCARALGDLNVVLRELFGPQKQGRDLAQDRSRVAGIPDKV
jgi:hypothetical protein